MKRTFLCLLCAVLLPNFVVAQDDTDAQVERMTDAVSALVQLSSFVDANVTFCAEHAPQAGVGEAAAAWYASSSLAILEQIKRIPDITATFREMEDAYAQETLQTLSQATGREAEWCGGVPILLQSPDWDVGANYAGELAVLAEFYTLVTGETPPTPLPQAQALPPVTSPTYAEVVAAGVNPEAQFIGDEFRCYDEGGVDYRRPYLIVQITGPGQYLSSYGGGMFRLEPDDYAPDVEWLSGPLKDAGSALYFDEYGQNFYLSGVSLGDESYDFRCFQQGASEQAALTAFRLKDPQPGTYQCRDAATGEAQALELSPGGSYQIGGASGTYAVSGILSDNEGSSIDWLTGPFAEQSSYYSEEPDNGFRSFDISLSDGRAVGTFVYSSSELALSCESLGEPVSFDKYGAGAAPPAPPTEIALDGFFYRYELEMRGSYSFLMPQFYRFFSSGYVFIGTPEGGPADIDCTRTKPNGAPFCDTYGISGNFIRLADEEPEFFALDGATPIIGEDGLTPVEGNTVTSLDGLFWANYAYSFGICGEYSFCSSSYQEWNYDLKPDHTFTYFTSSQNLSSMNSDLASTSVSAYSNSANTGGYTIDGNVIELRFDNGKVERNFILVLGPDNFIMGENEYTLKDESDSQ